MFIALPASEVLVFICLIFTSVFLLLGTSGDEYLHSRNVQTDKVIVVSQVRVCTHLGKAFFFGKKISHAVPGKSFRFKTFQTAQAISLPRQESLHHFIFIREFFRRGPPAA